MNSTITLSVGDNNSMSDRGYSYEELKVVRDKFGDNAYIVNLAELGKDLKVKLPEAYLLIISNPFPIMANNLYRTLTTPEEYGGVNWDTRYLDKDGTVKNKHSRWNLTFQDLGTQFKIEPDFSIGRETKYNYKAFKDIADLLSIVSTFPESNGLDIYANYYHNSSKCYIGFHGDTERRKAIGYRLGDTFPLYFQWYHKGNKITPYVKFDLQHGDLYMMSENATGTNYRDWNSYTLRHAAGPGSIIMK